MNVSILSTLRFLQDFQTAVYFNFLGHISKQKFCQIFLKMLRMILFVFLFSSRSQMEEAAEGHFTTEAQQWNQDERSPTISGQVILILCPEIYI